MSGIEEDPGGLAEQAGKATFKLEAFETWAEGDGDVTINIVSGVLTRKHSGGIFLSVHLDANSAIELGRQLIKAANEAKNHEISYLRHHLNDV